MKPLSKAGLIGAGYLIAAAIAFAVVAVYVIATDSPARQASGGMTAFGDALLFLAVFGVAAIPPTGAAFYCLRPYRTFWRVLSVAAALLALTAIAAIAVYIVSQGAGSESPLQEWSALVVLRILAAPLCALVFLLAGLFAPMRSARIALLSATAIEAAVFACIVFLWIQVLLSA